MFIYIIIHGFIFYNDTKSSELRPLHLTVVQVVVAFITIIITIMLFVVTITSINKFIIAACMLCCFCYWAASGC
jgi:hypothetical protein